jgi:hypothetical protein
MNPHIFTVARICPDWIYRHLFWLKHRPQLYRLVFFSQFKKLVFCTRNIVFVLSITMLLL